MNANQQHARVLLAEEMATFAVTRASGDHVAAWKALEQAHIIAQPFLVLHLSGHLAMLKYAIERREVREIYAQAVRLVLAPFGALTGRIPIGNTGRSNVSAFKPMPIDPRLKARMDSVKANQL